MKKLLYMGLLALLSLTACEKTNPEELVGSNKCVNAKIIASICGQAVLQIQDPDYYSYGENSWKNNDKSFDHVFYTTFSCTDMQAIDKLKGGDWSGASIKVEFVESIEMGDCMVCLATFANPPTTRRLVRVVNSCNTTK